MIEGAFRNAAHAHPGRPLDDRLARSISKRAAGTITSVWRDVLAMPLAWSEGGPGNVGPGVASDGSDMQTAIVRSAGTRSESRPRAASQSPWRGPLRHLHRAVGNAVGEAEYASQTERAEAFKDVLRLIARMVAEPVPLHGKVKLRVGK